MFILCFTSLHYIIFELLTVLCFHSPNLVHFGTSLFIYRLRYVHAKIPRFVNYTFCNKTMIPC